jgi:muramoyltetrapeptide carboxypeptidase
VTATRRLTEKSCIKVVLPASSLQSDFGMGRGFAQGYDLLQRHFQVENSRLWRKDYQGFAATDEERAAEINEAYASAEVDAIIAGRGGYGSIRLLNTIDYESIQRHPKMLIGFSDTTILQLAIFQKTGVVSLSGPMVATLNDRQLAHLLPLLIADSTGIDLIPPESKPQVEVINAGTAEGLLLGGNLFSLVQIIGSGFLPRLDRAILFIEDLDETVNRIDSFFNHLKVSGLLYRVAGVVIGNLQWRKKHFFSSTRQCTNLFRQRLGTLLRKEVPVIMGLNYGHVRDSITIPIGARAQLDTNTRSLYLLENVTRA